MTDIDWSTIRAALFDMDGVLTRTAVLHAAAWKRLFDDYLSRRAGGTLPPFDPDTDYRRYVDGKLREDGVASFLASRGILLPAGGPADDPDAETIAGLAKKKDAYFTALLKDKGVDVYEDGMVFLQAVRAYGLKTAVVSASRHAKAVLTQANLLPLFDVCVDGEESRRLHLKGKPDPAAFIEAARRLSVVASEGMVLEDALAGVQAGHRGGFGLVIGVDRGNQAADLKVQGAHVVVSDLRDALPPHLKSAAA